MSDFCGLASAKKIKKIKQLSCNVPYTQNLLIVAKRMSSFVDF